MAMRAFDVMIYDGQRSRQIDTVFFVPGHSAADVRRSLIDHDGYPPNISVYRRAEGRHAYDDIARASEAAR